MKTSGCRSGTWTEGQREEAGEEEASPPRKSGGPSLRRADESGPPVAEEEQGIFASPGPFRFEPNGEGADGKGTMDGRDRHDQGVPASCIGQRLSVVIVSHKERPCHFCPAQLFFFDSHCGPFQRRAFSSA